MPSKPSNALFAAPSKSGNRKASNASPIIVLRKAADKTVRPGVSNKAKASPVMEETVPREVAVAKVGAEAVRKAAEKIVPKKTKAVRKAEEEITPFPVVVVRPEAADSVAGLPTVPGPSGRSAEFVHPFFSSGSSGFEEPLLTTKANYPLKFT